MRPAVMKKFPLILAVASLTLSGLLAGCTMIPDYIRPDFAAAPQWDEVKGYSSPEAETAAALLEWDTFFDHPALKSVISTALANNKDLRQAVLNIEEARALYRVERANLLPDLTADLAASNQGSSDRSSLTGEGVDSELYTANLGLSGYELDFFGRIRSANRVALNLYLATTEAREVARKALIAETANAYLQFLADRKLLRLTEQTLQAQKRTHDILSQSLAQGLGTAQDVARAQTAVKTAEVNLHQYRRFVAQDKNALYLLMGVPHQDGLIPIASLDDIRLTDKLLVGLPAEVLLRRPDIRQAEYDLIAQNAQIGAARAAFFPRITLTGSYGYASDALSDLFTDAALGAWRFAPRLSVPIFRTYRNKVNLDLAHVRKNKAIVAYEQAIQTGFRDVADELAARATLSAQLEAQQELVAAAEKVYEISQARFKSGIDSFLSVLDAQRELYVFQQNAIRTEQQRLNNLVNLYRALGGG